METNERAASPSPPAHVNTCPPRCLLSRDSRPADLALTRTNGLTTLRPDDLKRRISDGRSDRYDTQVQVPRLKARRQLPKTPSYEAMGNTQSNANSSTSDNASVRNGPRGAVRVLRKSSTNLFNRMDAKSPIPPEVTTTTVIQVRQQASPPGLDGTDDESPVDPFMGGQRLSQASGDRAVRSPTTATITDEAGSRPLSATTTIRDSRPQTRNQSRRESRIEEDLESHENMAEPVRPTSRPSSRPTSFPPRISPIPPPSSRQSALSPTLPAPSPLPEDSPHKYGLKDRMDTPEVPEPEEIRVVKAARRRSSGLEIFNVRRLPMIAT